MVGTPCTYNLPFHRKHQGERDELSIYNISTLFPFYWNNTCTSIELFLIMHVY